MVFLCLLSGLGRFLLKNEDLTPGTAPPDTAFQHAGKYSDLFNRSLEKSLADYFLLIESSVDGNQEKMETSGTALKASLDSFKIEELITDTVLYDAIYLALDNVKAETAAIISDPDMKEKRASINILSGELFTILTNLGIRKPVYYWLTCPDAFGNGKEGGWIGETTASPDPYGCTGEPLVKKRSDMGSTNQ